MTGPALLLTVQQREKVTITKRHAVVKRSLLGGSSKTATEEIPIFSAWRLPPEPITLPEEVIRITVREFVDRPGAWETFIGTTDAEGRLWFSLAPLLDARTILGRRTPIHLDISCPRRNLTVTLTLPYEVISTLARERS